MYIIYTLISVLFLASGIYKSKKKCYIHILFYGIAIAINYYSAFFVLFFELASCKKALKKLMTFIIELIPINVVYLIEHFIFPEKNVCFWLPDFELWNNLFDVHRMSTLRWFWIAYILFLCYALVLSINPYIDDIEKCLAGGLGICTIFTFCSQAEIIFFIYMLMFTIYFACKCIDLKNNANSCLLTTLILCVIIASLRVENFGIVSRLINSLFDKLSFLGASTILFAIIAAIPTEFIWQWNKRVAYMLRNEV